MINSNSAPKLKLNSRWLRAESVFVWCVCYNSVSSMASEDSRIFLRPDLSTKAAGAHHVAGALVLTVQDHVQKHL